MFPETNPAPGFARHPDHTVRVTPFKGRVVVAADGAEIARTKNALIVNETNHGPVHYIPLEDVQEDYLRDSTHVSRCPFKGKARYWNIRIGNHEIDNAMWGYEMPYDEVLELAGLVAFFPNKVSISVDAD
jgi:uncharacterized protein (DUF427 family)